MKTAFFAIILLTLCLSASAQDDLLIKKTSDMKIPGMDTSGILNKASPSSARKARISTVMIKGSRLRMDSEVPTFSILHPSSATRELSYIQQCDLGRTVHLDHKKKSYRISGIAEDGPSKAKAAEKIQSSRKGGYVDASIEVTDTNERKNMFGFVAKHLKSTMTMTPSPNACNKQAMSIQDEGWYIDLPTYSCEIQTEDTMDSMQQTAEGCADEIRVKSTGSMHLGFAIQQTRTFSMNGMSFQMLENVISLDRSSLDASLFEIPTDFHPSGDSDAATATTVQPNSQNSQSTNSNTGPSSQYPAEWQNKPLPTMSQITSDASLPPKQPGVTRIGIVTPTADMGQGFEGIDAGQIAQAAFLDKLKADKIEAIPISSGILVREEAKVKQCDYLLYVDIKRKKGGGGGFLTKMIITNIGCMAGNAACAAASGTAGLPGHIKNKDEITLEYHLNKPDGTSAVPSTTLKQKAQKDGDDVLSPMIEQAGKSVISTLSAGK